MSRGENLPYSKHSEEIYSSVQFMTLHNSGELSVDTPRSLSIITGSVI